MMSLHTSKPDPPPELPESLLSLVKTHTVRFESWLHWDMNNGSRVANGFDVELHATDDHGLTHFLPAGEVARGTYQALRRIVNAILPLEEISCSCDVESFDQSIHIDGQGRLEVVLVFRLFHKCGYFCPIDDGEERCLKEVEDKLRRLGVKGARRH